MNFPIVSGTPPYWRTDQQDGALNAEECPDYPNRCRCKPVCVVCGNKKHTAVHGGVLGDPPNGKPYGHRFES
jgi:hypothetical protein